MRRVYEVKKEVHTKIGSLYQLLKKLAIVAPDQEITFADSLGIVLHFGKELYSHSPVLNSTVPSL
jgi:hypothetical protein